MVDSPMLHLRGSGTMAFLQMQLRIGKHGRGRGKVSQVRLARMYTYLSRYFVGRQLGLTANVCQHALPCSAGKQVGPRSRSNAILRTVHPTPNPVNPTRRPR